MRNVLSIVAKSARIAVGFIVHPEDGDLIDLTDVERGIERLMITDVLRLTNSIRSVVLEAALTVASQIGRVVGRGGERVGAIFMQGDSVNVLKGSRQLVPNPLHGHEDRLRSITNPDIHNALVEPAKLDGAFVIRGDGFIQSAAI